MQPPLTPIVGADAMCELDNGKRAKIVRLNNAATTPPFAATLQTVNTAMAQYGALHRGAGPLADATVRAVTDAIATIRSFFGVRDTQSLLFTENTSAAINLFARMCRLRTGDVVITSNIEHTSNNLPWQWNTPATVMEVSAHNDGSLDMDDLRHVIDRTGKRFKILAITGASNLTGFIPDIAAIARLVHAHDALLFVDAAQLAPHRPIDMAKTGIDALAFSAHKMYAPFGLGVLVLPTTVLDDVPSNPGGGSIDMISATGTIVWAPSSARHQTGTWNVAGIIGLAASCSAMLRIGWDAIVTHERILTQYAADRLANIPSLTMYVPRAVYTAEDRIGVFPFTLIGYHHALLAAILAHEYGIETRAGTICNHRLVRRWFNVSDDEQTQIEEKIEKGDRLASYGIVRASIGIMNTTEDIDALGDALAIISKNVPRCSYVPMREEETYVCKTERKRP